LRSPLIVRVDPNLAHVEEARLKANAWRLHQIAVLATQAGSPRAAPGKDTCFDTAWRQSAIWLAIRVSIAHYEVPMVRANCRARFTAADFDFIVRTLARSQTDQVSLVDLLSDVETRDSILDHPRLVDAILNHCGHLRISSQFYFYVLARHVLQQGGIGDRKLCDYVASLLEAFSHASRLQISEETHHLAEQYISDILIALNRATPEQAFLLRAHIGNYSLFISGIFHENTQRRSMRGGPDIKFYEQVGRTNYQLVSSHVVARRCELDDVFEGLADRFRDVRLALNQLSDQLLNLDEDARPSMCL
jgi:hypothetical protein